MRLLQKKREPVATGKVWDYTNDTWGHAIGMFTATDAERKKVHATGHGPEAVYRLDGNPDNELRLFIMSRMEVGDLLVLKSDREGDTACYRVDQVKYYSDPRDMWSADLSFYPRDPKEKDQHHVLLNKRGGKFGRMPQEPMPVVGDLDG